LRHGLLRCASFPGVAACPCGSGSSFASKPADDSGACRIGLGFAGKSGTGTLGFGFTAFDSDPHSALHAELRLLDLTIASLHP
jgi:hypothetical protein